MGAAAGDVELAPVVAEGLANSGYLVSLEEGSVWGVDPLDDPRPGGAAGEKVGVRVRYAALTHAHADFLSGAADVAAGHLAGAENVELGDLAQLARGLR